MRIANIQDTLLKIDLVQRLQESMLSQARNTQAEAEPDSFEHTRIRQETLEQSADTRESNIREEEKRRRQAFLARRRRPGDRPDDPGKAPPPPGDHIIDIKA
ncbi:MAG: hypothetical protein JW909_00920 [Planctomycetes bacterium]|nr:hypothetical protein [Planctomycetota bacterium]